MLGCNTLPRASCPCLMPAPDGQEHSRFLGPEVSSYELDGLEPATLYHVWLSVSWPSGEGPPTEVTAHTGEPEGTSFPVCSSPTRDLS